MPASASFFLQDLGVPLNAFPSDVSISTQFLLKDIDLICPEGMALSVQSVWYVMPLPKDGFQDGI